MSAHQSIGRVSATAAADAAPDLAAALANADFLPSRKTEGWSAAKQRQFLELVAVGHTVEAACYMCQLSHQSAYAFRASARGAVFALGWRAALLLARDRLADTLLARAFDGQTVTITRADGSQVERHYHDNRLAMATLTRLDRLAEADAACPVPGGVQAARLVAQEWDGFLDMVEQERGPARAALFLARRLGGDGTATPAAAALEPVAALARADLRLRTGAGDATEIAIDDLDPARRADWTAEQWARAEAAGLLRLAAAEPVAAKAEGNPQPPQHSRADDDIDEPVRWDEDRDEWVTSFPPPAGFDGDEDGLPGEEDYERTLSDDEAALLAAHDRLLLADAVATGEAARDLWFAQLAAAVAGVSEETGEGQEAGAVTDFLPVRGEEASGPSKGRLEPQALRDEASPGSASPQAERGFCRAAGGAT